MFGLITGAAKKPNPIFPYPSQEESLLLMMIKRLDSDPKLRDVADAYLAMQEQRLGLMDSTTFGDNALKVGAIELFAEAANEFYEIALAWFASPLPAHLEKRQTVLESAVIDWFRNSLILIEKWRESIRTGGHPSIEELHALEENRVDRMFEVATLHCELAECLIMEGLEAV